jgi:hypothetical protein
LDNIEASKLFFGLVLGRLQSSFPAAIHLDLQELWTDFAALADGAVLCVKDGKRSYTQLPIEDVANHKNLEVHYMQLMLGWMRTEGFIHSDPISDFPYDYVLSAKSLAILGQPFSEGKSTLGAALGQASGRIGEAVQSEVISRIVDKLFNVAQGLAG